MWGEWLVGGLPRGRQGSAAGGGSRAAAQRDGMHPHHSGVSYQPVPFALRRLLLTGLCIACCRDQGFQPSPCRQAATVRKAAASQAKDLHSECKHVGTDSKPVPVRAKPQRRDGEGELPQSPGSQAPPPQT